MLFAVLVFISPGLLNARKPALAALSTNVTTPGASVGFVLLRYSDPDDTRTVVVVCNTDVPPLRRFRALADRESVGVTIADVVVVGLAQVFVIAVVGIDSAYLATL
jgi:hypothetical protein